MEWLPLKTKASWATCIHWANQQANTPECIGQSERGVPSHPALGAKGAGIHEFHKAVTNWEMTPRGLILVDSPTTGTPIEAAGLQMPRISEKEAYLIIWNIWPERQAPTLTLNTLLGVYWSTLQSCGPAASIFAASLCLPPIHRCPLKKGLYPQLTPWFLWLPPKGHLQVTWLWWPAGVILTGLTGL